MINYMEQYNLWETDKYFDEDTKKELMEIKDNVKEIEDRFYRTLEFGTGGLRGVIGAGTNRMNIYTVRKTTQGLSNYVISKGNEPKNRGMVIAYDSRNKSQEFAVETAKVFAGNGIKAYLFDELRPVPELSFAVRHLNAFGGVVITASHNPKQYNGYKVYGQDGGQLGLEDSDAVINEVEKITDFKQINLMEKDDAINKGLIKIIGTEIDDEYITRLKTISINPQLVKSIGETLKIVYTPLHGTGNKPVRRLLAEMGFKNIIVVKEQELPDAEFSTVKYPNPEEKDAFKIAISLAKEEKVDLIIGTDPDCDRVGIVVKNLEGEYVTLTGNQTGCLLLDYILYQKKLKDSLPKNGFIVKTIVSTELARTIAQHYDIELIEVLTGFKFISEKIKSLDDNGDKKFIFGFEESYGYLAGKFSRDKDGVVTSMLICEMAAYYKSRGMTLYEGLREIYEKYGYAIESVNSFTLVGKEGIEKIMNTMEILREQKTSNFGEYRVSAIRDYVKGEKIYIKSGQIEKLSLPESNVLYYELEDNSWVCIRPSGTEPKIKIYYGVTSTSQNASESKMKDLQSTVMSIIERMLK